ncbi:hypothetical protein GOP47_0001339 [Adiantum capillus-veneris]|uniref:Uncharacterized protein n=1 Tax=Adiantum capillus-veneris TaxID=13818 RepID=A0A9D4ZQ00_ADICA|nr:hypothetical protein GOP47_0001339 [Adiantum capillus-veneris]
MREPLLDKDKFCFDWVRSASLDFLESTSICQHLAPTHVFNCLVPQAAPTSILIISSKPRPPSSILTYNLSAPLVSLPAIAIALTFRSCNCLYTSSEPHSAARCPGTADSRPEGLADHQIAQSIDSSSNFDQLPIIQGFFKVAIISCRCCFSRQASRLLHISHSQPAPGVLISNISYNLH